MVSSKVERDKVLQVAKYGVRKFFSKPVKIDSLMKTVGEYLGISMNLDTTPSIIEAHFNDRILFIEVAQGLNTEKIELLRYKVQELLELYSVKVPRVLVMMSGIDENTADSFKLTALFDVILDATGSKKRHLKVLTASAFVKNFLQGHSEYKEIEVASSLEDAMDKLSGKKSSEPVYSPERKSAAEEFISKGKGASEEETIRMTFEEERALPNLSELGSEIKVSVVDDDMVIQELVKTAFYDTSFEVVGYDDGEHFLNDEKALESDLVFLDLMMPKVDGFQVLEELRKRGTTVPVIVLSALSQKETVLKAREYGVTRYMIKPIQPENVIRKAAEVVHSNF
jgi:CheY-like chemotaxis protein